MLVAEMLDTLDTVSLVLDSALEADGRMEMEELLALKEEVGDAKQRLELLGDENESLREVNEETTQLGAIVDAIRGAFGIPDEIENRDIPDLLSDLFSCVMRGDEVEIGGEEAEAA